MSQNKPQVNITVNAEETIESCLTPIIKMLTSLPGNLLSVQQAQCRLFEFRAWISTALIDAANLQAQQAASQGAKDESASTNQDNAVKPEAETKKEKPKNIKEAREALKR